MKIFLLKRFSEINCIFKDVKWCVNASWGLKGLRVTQRQRFCQVKKNQNSEKNSEVGGRVKHQLGFFFLEIFFFVLFFVAAHVSKKQLAWGGEWVLYDQSESFSDIWISF